jgi:hypothetical protein
MDTCKQAVVSLCRNGTARFHMPDSLSFTRGYLVKGRVLGEKEAIKFIKCRARTRSIALVQYLSCILLKRSSTVKGGGGSFGSQGC